MKAFKPGKFLQSSLQGDLIDFGNTGNEMSNKRSNLLFSLAHDVCEKSIAERAPQFGEGVSVEEEKGSLAVEPLQMLGNLEKGQRFFLEVFPLFLTRRVTFRIRAVLSTLSLAESSVEVGDSLPVPVFEKTGSAQ